MGERTAGQEIPEVDVHSVDRVEGVPAYAQEMGFIRVTGGWGGKARQRRWESVNADGEKIWGQRPDEKELEGGRLTKVT